MESIKIKLENPQVHNDTLKKRKKQRSERRKSFLWKYNS